MSQEPCAGLRVLAVDDAVQGARVPVHLLYPADAPVRDESFGPYTLAVAREAPIAGERIPLVAISHGGGGMPWTHRGLAIELARAGFAALLVQHPGNSRMDDSLARTPANLANRPRHLRLALDAAFADPATAPHLAPGRAGVVGHSIGGYTALALAGGRPLALPQETEDGRAHPVPVEPDPRVAALVLLAPALPWFMAPGALDAVRAPLLVRAGEQDRMAPPDFIERILASLPADTSLDYQVVAGAGHFSFQSPFPPALVGPAFAPSQDPPGFDRAAYQARLAAEVIAFLRAAI